MILQLHRSSGSDELVVFDAVLRCEIPFRQIDHSTIEVDDAYSATASVMFIHLPIGATPERIKDLRRQALS